MTPSTIHALMARLIDYAGLFPPAKLDMPATVRNYADYLASPDAWMLGRLIVPVARLDEFEAAAVNALRQSAMDETGPWQISALTASAGTAELDADLDRIWKFNQQHEDDDNGLALIEIIELKADGVAAIENAMEKIAGGIRPFFEIDVVGGRDPTALIEAMAAGDCGAKVRTGGVTADLYPSSANLARFIHACAAANVPFKATAGMHHPLRHHSEAIGASEHGFLNVFLAAALALTDELDVNEIQELLEERSIDAIDVGDDVIEWRGRRLRDDSIEDVREEFAISFGSCSFDEPREDLRELGLLEPAPVHAGE